MATAAKIALIALLVFAAVIDARSRRLPNPLAALLALAGAACALVGGGLARLASHALCAALCCGALVAFELAWRRARGTFGQGMGDVKALGALMLAAPAGALAAYALALGALAAGCIVARRRALPLLPFLAAAALIAL